jgi:hypothetical protein
MKRTKKFLVISSLIICVSLMVLMFTLSAACIIIALMSWLFGSWKDIVVAIAIGYITALGGMSFLDTCEWLSATCRRLCKK